MVHLTAASIGLTHRRPDLSPGCMHFYNYSEISECVCQQKAVILTAPQHGTVSLEPITKPSDVSAELFRNISKHLRHPDEQLQPHARTSLPKNDEPLYAQPYDNLAFKKVARDFDHINYAINQTFNRRTLSEPQLNLCNRDSCSAYAGILAQGSSNCFSRPSMYETLRAYDDTICTYNASNVLSKPSTVGHYEKLQLHIYTKLTRPVK